MSHFAYAVKDLPRYHPGNHLWARFLDTCWTHPRGKRVLEHAKPAASHKHANGVCTAHVFVPLSAQRYALSVKYHADLGRS